jgi:hypothetical protein
VTNYSGFAETHGSIDAPVATVFDFLDDQANLSAHMSKPSGMMLGSTMTIRMEADHTRQIGSAFGFTGSILGIPLMVDEVVTGRQPPKRKTWETTSEPCLWVIGQYQMGFELTSSAVGSTLRVHIRYNLPRAGLPRLLGRLFGKVYAAWCTSQMVADAQKHFLARPASAVQPPSEHTAH